MHSPRGCLTTSGLGPYKVPAALSEAEAAGTGHRCPPWTSAPSPTAAYQEVRARSASGAMLEDTGHSFLWGSVGEV